MNSLISRWNKLKLSRVNPTSQRRGAVYYCLELTLNSLKARGELRLALWWPWPHSDVTESGRCMTTWLLFLGQCLRDRRQLLGVTTQDNSRVITTSCRDDSLVLWQSCDRKCCTNSTRLETNCNAVAESSISDQWIGERVSSKYVSSIYAIYGIIIPSLVLSLFSINDWESFPLMALQYLNPL